MGKPVWAGIAGYSAAFARQEIENAAVFHPCDVDAAVRAFDTLIMEVRPRTEFLAKYSRAHINRLMARSILSIGGNVRTDGA